MPRPKKATVDIKIRMKEPLRALIEKSAAKRGVSMNAEMVARLEHSFDNADLPPIVFGSGDSVTLAIVIGSIMRTVKDRLDARSLADPQVLPAIEVGLYEFFHALRDAMPDEMRIDNPRVGAGIDAGRKAADTFAALMRRHASAEQPTSVSIVDIENIINVAALRFSRFGTSGQEESD